MEMIGCTFSASYPFGACCERSSDAKAGNGIGLELRSTVIEVNEETTLEESRYE